MRTLIVVPTFNERENLPVLVRALVIDPDCSVLVVDDQSPDGTGAVAGALSREFPGRVQCLHRTGPRGLGRAYVAGFLQALTSPVEMICQMDADLSHRAADLPRLLAAARHADLVIGSRYAAGAPATDWWRSRRLLGRWANSYIRYLTRLPQRDCTSGFRCWRREALARIDLEHVRSRGYAFQVEMLGEAVRRGYRIAEVPVSFTPRRRGVSKLSAGAIAESALTAWRLRSRAPGGIGSAR